MDEQMMKEKFEHWYSNEGEYPKAIERTGDGKSYIYMGADSAWRAWQACAAALSQPAAQGNSSHSAGGECGGVQVPKQTLVEWALSATPEQLERGDWRIVCAGLRQAKERFAEAKLGNQSWLDCYIQIAESRGKEPEAGDRVQVPLTDSQAYAISAPIFSGGNRHPRAELELVRAIEAAHGIKATQ